MHFRGAGERPAEEIQHLGTHADEQFQTEGMCGWGFMVTSYYTFNLGSF